MYYVRRDCFFFLANSGDQDEMPHQADFCQAWSSLSDKLTVYGHPDFKGLKRENGKYLSYLIDFRQNVMDFLKPQMSHHIRFSVNFRYLYFIWA